MNRCPGRRAQNFVFCFFILKNNSPHDDTFYTQIVDKAFCDIINFVAILIYELHANATNEKNGLRIVRINLYIVSANMKTNKKTWVLLFLIIAFGLFLRSVNINHAPPGIYPDEAVNGMDALNAITYGKWQWFYEANNGREGLIMNINALLFKFMGVSVLALKLPNIIAGTLTIFGTFLLGRELFRSTRIGLISAFLVSTAFWAINFSRIAFRANLLPFVLVFSFYFLWKGVRTKSYWDFIWGGLFFGLGLHTYIAFRIAPLILVVAVVTFMINRSGFLKEYWKQIALFVVSAIIIASPMLYTFYTHPEYFSSRTNNVSVFNPEVNQGHLVKALAKSVGLSIIKYNIWGDQNWRHNFPPYALLDPITGIAFTFGFIYVILKFFHLWSMRFYKGERHPRLEIYTFLLAWFFVMLVPEFMTAEGNPHALRAIGTLPIVFIFSAITFEYFIRKSYEYTPLFSKLIKGMAITALVFVGVFNSVKYHLVWAKEPMTAQSFNQNLMEITDYLHTQPENSQIYIVAESMQRIPIQVFDWQQSNISYVYPGELDQINPTSDNFQIILTDYNDDVVNYIQNKFTTIKLSEIRDKFGMTYYIIK
jgi:4-amino-4-deoxy-L-arabinose transferase-like glycosyltransferase